METNFSVIVSLIGSLFTALSVLFALYVYRRRQDTISFAGFRTSLIDIRNNTSLLIEVLSESSLSEIGVSIARQIKSIYPDECTKEDILNLLSDESKRNYVVTAIHLGLRDSRAMRDARSLTDKLNRIPFEHESQLPLVTDIINGCLFHMKQAVQITTSSVFYIENIFDEETYKKEILPRLEKVQSIDLVLCEIAEIIYEISTSGVQSLGAKVFEEAENILNILVDTLSLKSDQELRHFRKIDQQLFRKRQIPEEEYAIEQMFYLLNQIRGEFTERNWDSIVASKTKISDAIKTDLT